MIKKMLLSVFVLSLCACQSALAPFDSPVYNERPARQNANRLQDLSLGLQLQEVRDYMGASLVHNSIDPKKPFKNPVISYEGKSSTGQAITIDVYVTYASAFGDCPEASYRTEPTVFIDGVLHGIGWSYVKKHENALAVNHLWIRRASEYEYLHECQ